MLVKVYGFKSMHFELGNKRLDFVNVYEQYMYVDPVVSVIGPR